MIIDLKQPQPQSDKHRLWLISEEACKQCLDRSDAFAAVEAVFAAMASGNARNFPVVREAIGHADALYGFKSGFDRQGLALGVKSGGYWPNNHKRGLTNHQSSIFLFDPDTGRLDAIVGGNYLTAIRTAAASAVSIAYLARSNASVLGMVGAGHQSAFQLRAAADQRDFKKVVAWNPSKDKLIKLAEVAESLGLEFEACEREQLCEQADAIITITSAHEPLLQRQWIKPGTHIACMGTDTIGKQEIDPAIMGIACVFTDEIAQSTSIGECQHAIADEIIKSQHITPIGDIINGRHPGRINDQQITVFDGTGVGLQDLATASKVLELAKHNQLHQEVFL